MILACMGSCDCCKGGKMIYGMGRTVRFAYEI